MREKLSRLIASALIVTLIIDPATAQTMASVRRPAASVETQSVFTEQAINAGGANFITSMGRIAKEMTFGKLRPSHAIRNVSQPPLAKDTLDPIDIALANELAALSAARERALASSAIQSLEFLTRLRRYRERPFQEALGKAWTARETSLAGTAAAFEDSQRVMEIAHERALDRERRRLRNRIGELALTISARRAEHAQDLKGAAQDSQEAVRRIHARHAKAVNIAQTRQTRRRNTFEPVTAGILLNGNENLQEIEEIYQRSVEEAHERFWLRKTLDARRKESPLDDHARTVQERLRAENSSLNGQMLLHLFSHRLVDGHPILQEIRQLLEDFSEARAGASTALRQQTPDRLPLYVHLRQMRAIAGRLTTLLGSWPAFLAAEAPWNRDIQEVNQALELWDQIPNKSVFPLHFVLQGIAAQLEEPAWTISDDRILALIGFSVETVSQELDAEFRARLRIMDYRERLQATELPLEVQRHLWLEELTQAVEAGDLSAMTAMTWWESPPALTPSDAEEIVDQWRLTPTKPIPLSWAAKHEETLAAFVPSVQSILSFAAGVILAAALLWIHFFPSIQWTSRAGRQESTLSASAERNLADLETISQATMDARAIEQLTQELHQIEAQAANVQQTIHVQEKKVTIAAKTVQAARERLQMVERTYSAPEPQASVRDSIDRLNGPLYRGHRTPAPTAEGGSGNSNRRSRTSNVPTSIDPPGPKERLIHFDKTVSGFMITEREEQYDAPSEKWIRVEPDPFHPTTNPGNAASEAPVNKGHMILSGDFIPLIIPPGFAPDLDSFEFEKQGILYDVVPDRFGTPQLLVLNGDAKFPMGVTFSLIRDPSETAQHVQPTAATREPMETFALQDDTLKAIARARAHQNEEARIGTLVSYIKDIGEYTLDREIARLQSRPPGHFVANIDRVKISIEGDAYKGMEFRALHCMAANTLLADLARELGYPVRLVTGFYVTSSAYDVFTTEAHAMVEIFYGGSWHLHDATPRDRDQKEAHYFGDLPINQPGMLAREDAERQIRDSVAAMDEAQQALQKGQKEAEALRQRRDAIRKKLKEAGEGLASLPIEAQEQVGALTQRLTAVDREFAVAIKKDLEAFVAQFDQAGGPMARERRELERVHVPAAIRTRYLASVVERAMHYLGAEKSRPLLPLYWRLRADLMRDPMADHPFVLATQKNVYHAEMKMVQSEPSARLPEFPGDVPFPHGGIAIPIFSPTTATSPVTKKETEPPSVLRFDASGSFPRALAPSAQGASSQILLPTMLPTDPNAAVSWVQGAKGTIRAFSDGRQVYDLNQKPLLFPPIEGRDVGPVVMAPNGEPFAVLQGIDANMYVVNLLTGSALQVATGVAPVKLLFDQNGTGFALIRQQNGNSLIYFKPGGRVDRPVTLSNIELVRHRGHVYGFASERPGNSWTLWDFTTGGSQSIDLSPILDANHLEAVTNPYTDDAYLIASIADEEVIYPLNQLGGQPLLEMRSIWSALNFNPEGGFSLVGQRSEDASRKWINVSAPQPEGLVRINYLTIGNSLDPLAVRGDMSYWIDIQSGSGDVAYGTISSLNPNAAVHGPYATHEKEAHFVTEKNTLIIRVAKKDGPWEIHELSSASDRKLSSEDAEDVSAPLRIGNQIAFLERHGKQWILKTLDGGFIEKSSVLYAEAEAKGSMILSVKSREKLWMLHWDGHALVPLDEEGEIPTIFANGEDGFYYIRPVDSSIVWKAHEGHLSQVGRLPKGVMRLTWGPDHRAYALVQSSSHKTEIWRVGDSRPTYTLPISGARHLSFDPDRKPFVLAIQGGRATIHNVISGKSVPFAIHPFGPAGFALLAFTPRGQAIVLLKDAQDYHFILSTGGRVITSRDFIQPILTADEQFYLLPRPFSGRGKIGMRRLADGSFVSSPKVKTTVDVFVGTNGRLFYSDTLQHETAAELLPDGSSRLASHGGMVTMATESNTPLIWSPHARESNTVDLWDFPGQGGQIRLGTFDLLDIQKPDGLFGNPQTGPEGTSVIYAPVSGGQYALLEDTDKETELALEQTVKVLTEDPRTAQLPEFRQAMAALVEGRMARTKGSFLPPERRLLLYLAAEGMPEQPLYLQSVKELETIPQSKEEARRALAKLVVARFLHHRQAYGTIPFNPSGLKETGLVSRLLNLDLELFANRRFPWRVNEHPTDRDLAAFSREVEHLMNDVPWLRLSPTDVKEIWLSPAEQVVRLGRESAQQTFVWILLLELLSAGLGMYLEAKQFNIRRSFTRVLSHWARAMAHDVYGYHETSQNFSLPDALETLTPEQHVLLKPYLPLLESQDSAMQAAAFTILASNGIVPLERSASRRIVDSLIVIPGLGMIRPILAAEKAWKVLADEQESQPVVGDITSYKHFMKRLQQIKDSLIRRLPPDSRRIDSTIRHVSA